ncbi:MAG: membrane protein insertion efficiency factor YidD [Bacteroidaceae bacterium]|nr:membrane protein insertion efficiency factor YidD [Bacteroidaceae bacterium]
MNVWTRLVSWFSAAVSFLLLLPIHFYRMAISPLFPPTCRFTPTCSQYAIDAIRKHGPLKGLYLACRRLLRCHPWGGSGYDPVPDTFRW